MVETMRYWKSIYFGRRAYRNHQAPEYAAYVGKSADGLKAAAEKHRARLIGLASNYATKNNEENYRQAKATVEKRRKVIAK